MARGPNAKLCQCRLNSIFLRRPFNHLHKTAAETAIAIGYSPAMATEAQIEANRNNATASTGPNTSEGKSKSSRNAVSQGLFSNRNTFNTSEADEYDELAAAMRKDLAPEGILEQTLANEITRAAWRLRRCARVEDNIFEPDLDPMENLATLPIQLSVDRARLQTYRILQRSIAELRKLQNERRFRIEILDDDFDTASLGLASYKDLMPAMAAEKRSHSHKRELDDANSPATKRSQSPIEAPANTPRNAPCPCGSGQKHKRCCGKNAPPILGLAA
jgi:hypothetical protein